MAEPADATAAAQTSLVVPLLEETAAIDVREVTTGRVRVSTQVETFDEIARADLTSETVEVTRVPVNTPVGDVMPQVRTEGGLTIVPVFEEVLVVEKRLMLKEELHILTRETVEPIAVPVTLRRQTATVAREDAAPDKAGGVLHVDS